MKGIGYIGAFAAAVMVLAAYQQPVPNFLYAPMTGSADPRRAPGSRAHRRWKRARASGRN